MAHHRARWNEKLGKIQAPEKKSIKLYPEQELDRMVVLERVRAPKDPEKSARYAERKQAILDEHDAWSYFESDVLLLLDALEEAANDRQI